MNALKFPPAFPSPAISTLFMEEGPPGDENRFYGRNERFERTRRITGYLVGALARFNNAKRAEEKDRLKHGTENLP